MSMNVKHVNAALCHLFMHYIRRVWLFQL